MGFDPSLILFLFAIYFLAGTVKGIIGMGMPTLAIGFSTIAIDPRTAISYVVIPMIFLNIWQIKRAGQTWAAIQRYIPFAFTLCIGVFVSSLFAGQASDQILYAFTGVAIIAFVLVNATTWAPKIPKKHDAKAQFGFGGIAGVLGGFAAIWAPPLAIYLTARNVTKDEFVRATGLLIFMGSLPLCASYMAQGIITANIAVISLSLLLPAFCGFGVGEWLRHRLSEKRFRRVLLFLFFAMGLNLLRRAVF